jgi:hypothetical protein
MSIQSKLSLLVAALVAGTALLATPDKAEASLRKAGGDNGTGKGSVRVPSCVRIPNLSKDGKTIFYSEVCP